MAFYLAMAGKDKQQVELFIRLPIIMQTMERIKTTEEMAEEMQKRMYHLHRIPLSKVSETFRFLILFTFVLLYSNCLHLAYF